MDAFEALHTRRSIRQFLNRPVGEDIVKELLSAAMSAPTAGGIQPWRFVGLQRFQSSVKPRYQTAYEDYLYDLQVIAQTGRAPDNEALYDDLRVMNNNETFIYADSQD